MMATKTTLKRSLLFSALSSILFTARMGMAAPVQTTVTIAGSSPTPIVAYNAGDTVSIVATLATTDPNENGEGEPLNLQSSTGFSTTLTNYSQPTSYSFTAQTAGSLSGFIQGFDADESATVTVTLNSNQKKRFPQAQKDMMAKSAADLAVQSTAAGALALICLVAPDPSISKICAFTSGSYAASTALLSAVLNRLALDPSDPSFKIIAQPIVPSLPLMSGGAEATAFNALLVNEEQLIAYLRAAIVTIDRAQGAADAGDAIWEARQVAALNGYVDKITALLRSHADLLLNTQKALAWIHFQEIPVSANAVFQFESQVATQGLPAPILTALTQLKATPSEIDQVRSLLFVQDINLASGSFPQFMSRPVASINQLVNSLGIIVGIDIIPGNPYNRINPKSCGLIPVAILSTANFNAPKMVDLRSLTFGRTGDEHSLGICNARGEDVNKDGKLDLVCKFRSEDTKFRPGDTAGYLHGKTNDGVPIKGSDRVQIPYK